MINLLSFLLGIVVAYASWMTPMSGHHTGWLVNYGDQSLIEYNASYRGYDLSWSPTRCGVAVTSPKLLGAIVWIRPPGGRWTMCYGADSVARVHWHDYVIRNGAVADVPRHIIKGWGSDYGVYGEIWVGQCPPGASSVPVPFRPAYAVDSERPVRAYSGWPYPAQQIPSPGCNMRPGYGVEFY